MISDFCLLRDDDAVFFVVEGRLTGIEDLRANALCDTEDEEGSATFGFNAFMTSDLVAFMTSDLLVDDDEAWDVGPSAKEGKQ